MQGGVGAAPGRPLQVVAGPIKCAVSLVFIPVEDGIVILLNPNNADTFGMRWVGKGKSLV